MDNTLQYYNKNAVDFVNHTINANLKDLQDHFLQFIPVNGRILDFGCGSGRDTKYFINQEYCVDAIDGSSELCRFASKYTGIKVMHMTFQELSEIERYDGIWACSSILHLPRADLLSVMKKMQNALKEKGIIYTSFKYGNFEGWRNERYFTDFTEKSFADFISKVSGIRVEEYWITSDVRPGRDKEKWLNLILRKNKM